MLCRSHRTSPKAITDNAPKVYLNHVNIALGSQAELDTQFEIARRLGYVTAEDLKPTLEKLARVGQMLHGLQRSLEASPTMTSGLLALFCAFALWLALA